jgi:hypothetical protein
MAQIIIFKNSIGGVSVCIPTGELSIEKVLIKDCPTGAIIIDENQLPQGDDANYFDAWELVDGIVVVNADKKTSIQAKRTTELNVKDSALSKLTALGLTSDEITALVGK